ncbi:DUF6340 family protein [Rufibacter sediminis]|uniref:Tetratricopeptide repeat protein n=1 Tax=Rufibacter sediminis TaxID=2762756 RepID=A0ABR6VLT5_9BACT|nr:DUF6340 family protein [Rufibacter sediminis]MBC3538199.1 hypothetical protein [Rufibacter sediminis]
MKMKIGLSFVTFCLLAVSTSCTKQLFVKVEQPPAHAFPKQDRHLLIVPLYQAASLYKKKEKAEVYQFAAQEAIAGATTFFRKDSSYHVQVADSQLLNRFNLRPQRISASYVQQICQERKVSQVLFLQEVTADIQRSDVTLGNLLRSPLPSLGPQTNTWHYSLLLTTQWALYDQTGALLDSTHVTARKPYVFNEKMTKEMTLVGPALENSLETVHSVALANGQAYAQRFFPKAIVVHRPYYRTGALAPAAEWIEIRNWKEAAELLLPLAQDASPSTAAKAAYNLALMSEAQGNLEEAKQWAQLAASAGNRLARKMLSDLK